MPFITQGKTNWKFLLIVVILAVIVGGGIFGYYLLSKQKVNTTKMTVSEVNLSVCDKIQDQYTKEYCYLKGAEAKQDFSICDNIQTQSMKGYCYLDVAEKFKLASLFS